MMWSVYRLNKQGDSRQRCHTPFLILNQSVVPYRVLTVASWPSYRFLRRQGRWSGIAVSLSFPQFVMIYIVKDFIIVDETEVDVFLKFPCFLYNPANVGNFTSSYSSFSKPSMDIWKFLVCLMLKSSIQDFKHDWLFWPTAKYSMFLHELNWTTSFPVTLHCLLTLCYSHKEPLTVSRTFHGLSSPWAFAYVVHSIWNALPHFWQLWLTHWVLEQM